MNNKQNSNSFFASIGRGIKQAARWVARMFGYKAENKFARGVWYVFATSASIVALIIAIGFVRLFVDWVDRICADVKYRRQQNDPTYLHDFSNKYVSPYVIYHDWYPSYLYNMKTGRRTLTGIQWICKSSDGDSIACYSTAEEHKRGYFNRFTGEVVVPAQYQKAWIFSEGLACVYDKGMLHFIDHKGNLAIDKDFPYTPCIDDYCFHHGLCLMSDGNGRVGLIGRDGEWKVQPEYSGIIYETKGYWRLQDTEGRWGLLRADGEPFLPCEYASVTVRNTGYISLRQQNHLNMLLDSEGNVVNACDYMDVEKMEYVTDEYDEYGDLKRATAHCLLYRSSDYNCGLMDRNGNVITLPLYDQITAISASLYLCEGDEGAVILDDKGRETGEKL